jgi:hypothetical protein
MSKLDMQTLQSLEKMGVNFSVWVTSENGSEEYHASPQDLLVLESDREKFNALAHGLTLDQYKQWTGSGWSVICSATTKAGARCTNYVRAGCQIPASEWLKRIGEKCASHGG